MNRLKQNEGGTKLASQTQLYVAVKMLKDFISFWKKTRQNILCNQAPRKKFHLSNLIQHFFRFFFFQKVFSHENRVKFDRLESLNKTFN